MRRLLKLVFCLGIASTVLVTHCFYGFPEVAAQRPRIRKTPTRAKQKLAAASVEEVAARREHIHRRMLNGEYQHDGSAELIEIGNLSSVPALLQVLKDNPPTIMPDGRSFGICTIAHAHAALVKITGNKNSRTYQEWSKWWEQYQKEHRQN